MSFSSSIIARNDQQLSLEDAIALVHENSNKEWRREATAALYTLCSKCPNFDLDDVARVTGEIVPQPHDNRATAQIMRNAKRDGWCRQVGVTTSKRASRHRGYIATYESLIY